MYCNCGCEPENLYRTIYGFICKRCYDKISKEELV